MAKQGQPQMQRRHDDNRRNRRANDKTRLADCRERVAELEQERDMFKYIARQRMANGSLEIAISDRVPDGESLIPLSRARQLEGDAYQAGAAALANAFQDFEIRWQPVRAHTFNILAITAGMRGALLFADLRADRAAIKAFMRAQSALLDAHARDLRNLWATLVPDVEPDTLPLQRLVTNVQDGVLAFMAGDAEPLRAIFDTPDWLRTVEIAVEAAGRGPGPQPGSTRLHTDWLRQQVRQLDAQLDAQNEDWSAGQIAQRIRYSLEDALRRDGVLPKTQQAALETLQGTTAANTVSVIRRELRALAKLG